MIDERKEFAELRKYDARQLALYETALATLARQFIERVVYINSGLYIFYLTDDSWVSAGNSAIYDALLLGAQAAKMIECSNGMVARE